MKDFAALYEALDAQTATSDKVAALVRYFQQTAPADAAWAVVLLSGGKPRQLVPTAVLRDTACAVAGVDDWLFDACYQAVGDLAETIAHILPPGPAAPAAADAKEDAAPPPQGLDAWLQHRLLPLRGLPRDEQAACLKRWWGDLDGPGRFLLVKLIGGGFRVGVSKLLVQRALAQCSRLPPPLLAQRLVGWTAESLAASDSPAARWQTLVAPADAQAPRGGQPYPFFLAHALQEAPLDAPLDAPLGAPHRLGPLADWLVEWKYDGIRAQLVKREGGVWLWSRGEELVTATFPEVVAQAAALPDGTVLDGELLAWLPGQLQPAPFALLQRRINRKTVGKKLLADAPVRLLAYDLLEAQGEDLRGQPQQARRARLVQVLAGGAIEASPEVVAEGWAQLAQWRDSARARGVEGFMLKHRAARYGSGRTKADGTWWKWKVDPLTVDAVLIYAQAGHGRRASVYTDYTFAVWSRAPASADEAQAVVEAIARREPPPPVGSGALQLLPFAKAYSGLSDDEFKAVDRVIRATTLEKFGPVRSVRPTLVFEIGFEGLGASPRHKSGVAVRFPRMLRIRHDKPLHEAGTLQELQALMAATQ